MERRNFYRQPCVIDWFSLLSQLLISQFAVVFFCVCQLVVIIRLGAIFRVRSGKRNSWVCCLYVRRPWCERNFFPNLLETAITCQYERIRLIGFLIRYCWCKNTCTHTRDKAYVSFATASVNLEPFKRIKDTAATFAGFRLFSSELFSEITHFFLHCVPIYIPSPDLFLVSSISKPHTHISSHLAKSGTCICAIVPIIAGSAYTLRLSLVFLYNFRRSRCLFFFKCCRDVWQFAL